MKDSRQEGAVACGTEMCTFGFHGANRSQNPEGPATGHLDPGFLGFPGS